MQEFFFPLPRHQEKQTKNVIEVVLMVHINYLGY